MTTFTDFVPSSSAPFQFRKPTLDGQTYTAIVTWNLFGRRYYLNLFSLAGTLIFCRSLVGSAVGIVMQTLSWTLGTVTATTSVPHGYDVGATVALTIAGAAPDGYNGKVLALATAPNEFTYALAAYPGPATASGSVNYDVDLADGYFNSTLVYRAPSRQFEVTP